MNGLVIIIGWLALGGRYPMAVDNSSNEPKKSFTELVHDKFRSKNLK